MTAQPVDEDGNLPEARRALEDATTALIDPKPETNNGTLVWTDSLYQQLTEAIPGTKGEPRGILGSQPPLWIDAQMLLNEIDTEIRGWLPKPFIGPAETPFTVQRLKLILNLPWRPQDVRHMTTMTTRLRTWTDKITGLLSEQPHKHIPAPCPACNTKFVYRNDSAGEKVRQPTLQISEYGCQCQNCKTVWSPDLFLHLARVLGYELPDGVLE